MAAYIIVQKGKQNIGMPFICIGVKESESHKHEIAQQHQPS